MPRPEPEGHVRVGQIVGVFGTKGAMKVLLLTDFPERFELGSLLYLHGTPYKVKDVGWHKGQARVRFAEIGSIEAVAALKWEYLTVPEEDLPKLDEDEFLARDLVGLSVYEKGKLIGLVEDVIHAPAHDLLQIAGALVPCVHEFVKGVDLESRRIDVELIEGMRPGEDAEEVR